MFSSVRYFSQQVTIHHFFVATLYQNPIYKKMHSKNFTLLFFTSLLIPILGNHIPNLIFFPLGCWFKMCVVQNVLLNMDIKRQQASKKWCLFWQLWCTCSVWLSQFIVKLQKSAWREFFLFIMCKNNHKHAVTTKLKRFNHYSPVWPLVQVESPCLTMSWRRRPCFEVVTFERTHRIPSENSPIRQNDELKTQRMGKIKATYDTQLLETLVYQFMSFVVICSLVC